MQAIQQGFKAVETGTRGVLAGKALARIGGDALSGIDGIDRLVEEARWRLLRASRGNARAAADLRGLRSPLVYAAGKGNAQACEVLAAMSSSGLGALRDAAVAKEWMLRAVELVEAYVTRPLPGRHGFMLLPGDTPECAYRPLYTASGVLITDEIGTARIDNGEIAFDRWGRPELVESAELGSGPTRATPRSVAARIARESTLEDFAWACRRTTPEFRQTLLDARVIAHGRLGFQRCRSGIKPLAQAA